MYTSLIIKYFPDRSRNFPLLHLFHYFFSFFSFAFVTSFVPINQVIERTRSQHSNFSSIHTAFLGSNCREERGWTSSHCRRSASFCKVDGRFTILSEGRSKEEGRATLRQITFGEFHSESCLPLPSISTIRRGRKVCADDIPHREILSRGWLEREESERELVRRV